MNIKDKAKIFAIAAHSAIGQVRKYTNDPYWVHPIEVAEMVERVGGTDEMVAAAYLHDVIEDTSVTLDLIRQEFDDEVAAFVDWLTDKSTSEDGNRAKRKAIDRERLSRAPASVATIKLADLISNSHSIIEYDPNFAKIYLEEKRLLLEVLDGGNQELYNLAWKIVAREQVNQMARELVSVQPMPDDLMKKIGDHAHKDVDLKTLGYRPVSQLGLLWIKDDEQSN